MKKVIVFFITLLAYVYAMGLFGEYVVSREMSPFLQFLLTLGAVLGTAGMLGYAKNIIIYIFKRFKR
jgi:hypothetical protein